MSRKEYTTCQQKDGITYQPIRDSSLIVNSLGILRGKAIEKKIDVPDGFWSFWEDYYTDTDSQIIYKQSKDFRTWTELLWKIIES